MDFFKILDFFANPSSTYLRSVHEGDKSDNDEDQTSGCQGVEDRFPVLREKFDHVHVGLQHRRKLVVP